jgi:hypothetical protein
MTDRPIMRFNIIGNLINPDPNGLFVRHEDHARALESRVLAERKEPVGYTTQEAIGGLTRKSAGMFTVYCSPQRGIDVPLFTHPTPDDAKTREAFEKALKQTYEMVDPLNPPVPGSYARGEHNGIIAALKTVRANFDAAIDRAMQSGEEGNE